MIRVAISTSSQRLNQALRTMLKELDRFEIVTRTPPPDEWHAREADLAIPADVVVTDDASILDAAANGMVRSSRGAGETGPGLVLLFDDDEMVAGARPLHGGLALLPIEASAHQVVAAIEATAAGLAVLHPDHAGSLSLPPSEDPLTPREREVLQLLAAGFGNKEIANRLLISDHTAKFHVSQILAKLGAATRAEAVSIAMRRGLVPL